MPYTVIIGRAILPADGAPKPMKYEIVHDKVRIRDREPKQWLVYVDDVLRAEATSEQSAKDYVTIARAKER